MLHKKSFHAMGCQMQALVDGDFIHTRALDEVPGWFEGWEQVLSRFRPESELSRLNREPGWSTPVSQTLWDVFLASIAAETLTGGLVTPTVYDALIQAGYDRSFETLPRQQILPNRPMWSAVSALEKILWDAATQTICIPPGIHLDLGGVAKGWAAHQAAQKLSAFAPALVDAAGDVSISGPQTSGKAWPVGIADPFDPSKNLVVLHLSGGGVATSGRDRRNWTQNAQPRHHIIDPRSGQPAQTDLLTVTIVAPSVMEAEAAAKAVFILGSYAGLEWLAQYPEMAALLVLQDGRWLFTEPMQAYL